MEQIDLNKNITALYCISHILAEDPETLQKIILSKHDETPGVYDFELKINGVEIPLSKYLEYEREVNRQNAIMVMSRYCQIPEHLVRIRIRQMLAEYQESNKIKAVRTTASSFAELEAIENVLVDFIKKTYVLEES